jgi:hypothetical protein
MGQQYRLTIVSLFWRYLTALRKSPFPSIKIQKGIRTYSTQKRCVIFLDFRLKNHTKITHLIQPYSILFILNFSFLLIWQVFQQKQDE